MRATPLPVSAKLVDEFITHHLLEVDSQVITKFLLLGCKVEFHRLSLVPRHHRLVIQLAYSRTRAGVVKLGPDGPPRASLPRGLSWRGRARAPIARVPNYESPQLRESRVRFRKRSFPESTIRADRPGPNPKTRSDEPYRSATSCGVAPRFDPNSSPGDVCAAWP